MNTEIYCLNVRIQSDYKKIRSKNNYVFGHFSRSAIFAESWEVRKRQKQPPNVFYKKGVLKNFEKFTGKHLHRSLFFNNTDVLILMFSCEFCEIFKNAFFTELLRVAAPEEE